MKATFLKVAFVVAISSKIFAQISLVKDINAAATLSGSNPSNLTTLGGYVYYAANDGVTGNELWKSDGVSVSQVKDINAGDNSSNPSSLTVVGSYIYFVADDGMNGAELWRTDGTANGTKLVSDINPGSNPSSPLNLTVINSTTLYFSANDGTNGVELWKTGTGALSASIISDINSGPASSSPSSFVYVTGTTIYFSANDGSTGVELWKSDGTLTTRIADIVSGPTSSFPTYLTVFGSSVVFSAYDATNGIELWITNGTQAGTSIVSNINPGAASSSPANLTVMGSYVYFQATDFTNGVELWRSDGLSCTMVSNINPTPFGGSNPSGFNVIGSILYFWATSDSFGYEVYKTTGSGATLINLDGGADLNTPNPLVNISGILYFQANDGVKGKELMKYDGASLSQVDILPGSVGSNPSGFTLLGTNVLFSADNGSGAELMKISTSGNSASIVVDLVTGSSGSNPGSFVNNGSGITFFVADDGTGQELWKTDGTTLGTSRVKDINLSGPSNPSSLTMIGSYLYFSAYDGTDFELYRTDGTTTVKFDLRPGSGSSNPSAIAVLNSTTLLFAADDGTNGSELWKVANATSASPTISMLTNINTAPGAGSNPHYLTLLGTNMVFVANDGVKGTELWKTDGTTTSLLFDIETGFNSSSPTGLTLAGSTIYFQAYTSANGYEPWKTDGITTSLLLDIYSAGLGSSPTNFTAVGSIIYFQAYDATNGTELWKSDGTTTALVKDINNTALGASSNPTALISFNNKLYFQAYTPANGNEVWMSDGTSGGTTLFMDINTGTFNGNFSYPVVSGSSLYFISSDGSGNKIWVTDGVRSCATFSVPPYSGVQTTGPTGLTLAGSKIYFSMLAQGYGREPFVLDPSSVSIPVNTAISTQPSTQTAIIGNSVSFSVAASGTNLTYQWQKNSANIPSANSSTYNIASVASGDAAQYRCNVSGTCGNVSSNQATLTVYAPQPTAQPTALTFSNRTTTSIDLSFTVSATASGYLILRKSGSAPTEIPTNGTAYTVGSAFGASVVISDGPSTSFSDVALSSGTNYFYAIFAFNGTGATTSYYTASPLTGNTVTLAVSPTAQPTALVFSGISTGSISGAFTNASPAPEGYIVMRSTTASVDPPVDGTSYSSGMTIGASTVVYSGTSTGFTDARLLFASNYYYQIFSFNGSGNSTNYLTTSPLSGNSATLDAEPVLQPTNLSFGSVGVTTLTASFTASAIPPVTGYLVIRNTSAPTSIPTDGTTYTRGNTLSGTDVVAYVGSNNSFSETGLIPTTTYYYAVFAYNNGAGVINYLTSSPLLGNVTTIASDTNPPMVSNGTNTFVTSGLPITVTANVTDGESGVQSVVLKYRSMTGDGTYSTVNMTASANNNWQFAIPANQIGDIGIEFVVVATDNQNNIKTSNTFTVLVTYSDQSIPYTSFGSDQANYRLISIPLNLSHNTVDAVFGPSLGNYDDTKWRLFHYTSGSNTELTGSSTFKIGDGYWFIAKNQSTLPVGAGTAVVGVDPSNPFTIDLVQGWNQIGNPYLFNIAWQDVQAASNNNLKVRTYNGTWADGDRLHKFEGGFVFAGQATTLTIPTQKNALFQSGRYASTNVGLSHPLGSSDWEVSFKLKVANLTYELGGLGMRMSAQVGYDQFDDYTLPRLADYLEINHEKTFANVHYSRDIVPTSENHIWNFTIDSNKDGITDMTWDNSYFGNNDISLALVDLESKEVIDMKSSTRHSFLSSNSHHFRVVYGSPSFVKDNSLPNELVITKIYPNPVSSSVTIGFTTPNYPGEAPYSIELLDVMGQHLSSLFNGTLPAGSYEFTWDCSENFGNRVPQGVYLIEVRSKSHYRTNRIVIK